MTSQGHGSKLGRKRELALTALLTEPTIALAAEKAGISPSTLLRWLKDPTFNQMHREQRRELMAVAVAKLQASSGEAAETARELMLDPDMPPATRLSAARTILDLALRGMETEDIVERLAVLEQSVHRQRGML